jgi:hypothetical protein
MALLLDCRHAPALERTNLRRQTGRLPTGNSASAGGQQYIPHQLVAKRGFSISWWPAGDSASTGGFSALHTALLCLLRVHSVASLHQPLRQLHLLICSLLQGTYVCVCMCMHVYACVCMCMHVYACVCMCMHVYACECMCIHVYAYTCMCMHL